MSYPEEAYSKVLEFHFTAALCMQVLQVTYAKRGEDYIYKCIIGRKLFCNTSRSNDLLQFFTHHFLYDFRWFLTLLLFIVFFRTFVEFSLRGVTYKMPLVLSFFLSDSLFGLQKTSQHFSVHGNIQTNGKLGISFT